MVDRMPSAMIASTAADQAGDDTPVGHALSPRTPARTGKAVIGAAVRVMR